MLKILIADDEVIERLVLEKKLKKYYKEEHLILVAQNGRQVLEIYEREHPQILILDIEMPGINGLQAAQEIRKKDKACSIIFLTAFDEFSYAKAAISVHALDYLLKPCDERELINAVDESIRLALPESSQTRLKASEQTQNASSLKKSSGQELPKEQQEGDEQQEEFRTFITQHYMEDYFCKLFKQYFGHSFVSYLTEYRMRRAEDLISTSSLSIKEIGIAVGYPDPNYFTKVFRRVRGVSPSGFRDSGKQ